MWLAMDEEEIDDKVYLFTRKPINKNGAWFPNEEDEKDPDSVCDELSIVIAGALVYHRRLSDKEWPIFKRALREEPIEINSISCGSKRYALYDEPAKSTSSATSTSKEVEPFKYFY